MLQSLDLSKKIELTTDESTTLSGYLTMIPPIFGRAGGGNSALSSTRNTFLPALKEKEDWETKTILDERLFRRVNVFNGDLSNTGDGYLM